MRPSSSTGFKEHSFMTHRTAPHNTRYRSADADDNQAAIHVLNEHGARIEHLPRFLAPVQADAFLAQVVSEVEFDSREASRVFVHGRWRDIPRLQTAFGDDPAAIYRFSGNGAHARPWAPSILALRDRVARQTGRTPTFALVLKYDPLHHLGWHSDDERDLDPSAPIASLSLGASCDFQFRPRERGAQPGTVTMRLDHGSLLLMWPPTNGRFLHCVPKRVGANTMRKGTRVNITFREMTKR